MTRVTQGHGEKEQEMEWLSINRSLKTNHQQNTAESRQQSVTLTDSTSGHSNSGHTAQEENNIRESYFLSVLLQRKTNVAELGETKPDWLLRSIPQIINN